MKLRNFIFIAAALASFSCTEELAEVAVSSSSDPASMKVSDKCLVPGEAIVELTEEFAAQVEKDFAEGKFLQTKAGGAADVFASIGATSVERLYPDAGEWEPRHREAGLHRWYRIKYDESLAATKACTSLESIGGVVYTEPVRKIKMTSTFNDPYFSRQWHYYNDGHLSGYVAGADVNVVPVWENFTTGSNKVIVSVVDGGIQMDHPDLAAAVVPAGANGSKSFIYGYTGYTIYAHEHGTHVAGTIGAINNNGKGVCGIAGGDAEKGISGVRLMSCAIFMTNSKGEELGGDSYNAMVWGADHGAVISQNSWGYVYDSASEAARGGVGSMKSAIDYFIRYAGCDKNGNQKSDSPMKGGVVIFAAGNDNWPDGWPAEYAPVIAVGAISGRMTRSYYSNYGDWVDICAPGGDYQKDSQVYSTVSGSQYAAFQGTSMACPHVSGVAALIVSHFGGPGFTNEMLIDRLLEGARYDTQLKNSKIGPLVDAYGSFQVGGSNPPDKVEDFTVSSSANSIDFSWKVTADSDSDTGKAFGYLLLASQNQSDFANFRASTLPSTMLVKQVAVGDKSVGDDLEDWIADLEFNKTYYTAIIGYDYGKVYSELSPVKQVKTGENNPPVIETDYTGDYNVRPFETLAVTYRIYDPDHHNINVRFTYGSAADKWVDNGDGTYTLTITGNKVKAGNYNASILVSDDVPSPNTRMTTRSIKYTVRENSLPKLVKDIENMLIEAPGMSLDINMDEYIKDDDGETLRYEITHSKPTVAHLNPSGNMLTMTALNYGLDEITVTAYDCLEASCSTSFKICVRKAGSDADVFPSSVKDYLYVNGVKSGETAIVVANSNGTVIYRDTVVTDVFTPAKIDMKSCAPGLYTVNVTIDGKKTTRTIAKI